MSATHFLTSVLRFDDGTMEGQVFHEGTKKDCARVSNMLPAIAYSGDRKVVDARMAIVPFSECTQRLSVGEQWRFKP